MVGDRKPRVRAAVKQPVNKRPNKRTAGSAGTGGRAPTEGVALETYLATFRERLERDLALIEGAETPPENAATHRNVTPRRKRPGRE